MSRLTPERGSLKDLIKSPPPNKHPPLPNPQYTPNITIRHSHFPTTIICKIKRPKRSNIAGIVYPSFVGVYKQTN